MRAQRLPALCLLLLLAACATPWFARYRDADVYYATASGYDLPLHLELPLAPGEAPKLGTYYVAHYDHAGRITKIWKVSDGQTAFTHMYEYDEKGRLVSARITSVEGGTHVLKRGPDGKLEKQ